MPLREFTVESMTQKVRDARGHALVLVLYDPESDDAYLVGDLYRWTTQVKPRVELFALAVGDRRDAQFLFRYAHEEGVQRIAPEWLASSDPGMLQSAMAGLGVRVGDQWSPPLAAVIEPNGTVTAQWQGEMNYGDILTAAKAARQVD